MKKVCFRAIRFNPNSGCYEVGCEEYEECRFDGELEDNEAVRRFVEDSIDYFEDEGFSWNDWDEERYPLFAGLGWENAEVLCVDREPCELYYVREGE